MWGFESLARTISRAALGRVGRRSVSAQAGTFEVAGLIRARIRLVRSGFRNVSIKTVETENEGLKRAFMLTIPAEDIEARVEQEVKRLAPQIRMPGFRPGKVPPNLIRKMHGDSLRGEALQGAVQDSVQQLLSEQKIRPALQPQVELDDGYTPGKDAEVRVSLEALPDVRQARNRRPEA